MSLTAEQEAALRANTTTGDPFDVHSASVAAWRNVWALLDSARASLETEREMRQALEVSQANLVAIAHEHRLQHHLPLDAADRDYAERWANKITDAESDALAHAHAAGRALQAARVAELEAKLAQAEQERNSFQRVGIRAQARELGLREALKVAATALVNDEYLHADDCPADDTCECELPRVINAALASRVDDAALREWTEKAMTIAWNWGWDRARGQCPDDRASEANAADIARELDSLLGGGK